MTKTLATHWKIYWVWVAITLLIYLAMILWSLPKISEMAGGALAFDLRPAGYSFDEARSFLTSLGPEGADFYLHTQQLLDTAYPGMLGVTLVGALIGLDRGGWGWVLSVFAISGSIFDYFENIAVRSMLITGSGNVTNKMVEEASSWTFLKSVCDSIAMIGLLFLVLIALYRYFSSNKAREDISETIAKKDEEPQEK
ncbi:MAG: hypothetical protein WBD01_10535 [Salaquimonas sp.]